MPEMTAEEAAEWGKSLSFEKVWAIIVESEEKLDRFFRETDRKFAEAAEQSKETDRKIAEAAEQSRETDRKIAESAAQLARLEKTVERVSNNVGGLNRSVGELVETLIAARLWEKFPQYDLRRASQRIPISDERNVRRTDIDILLVNTSRCMIVEVKRELDRMDDVSGHIKRMELIRQYPPGLITDKQQLLGAVAGGVVDPDIKDYAYKSGFYVLELTGESVHLITPPEGFVPKKW
jgi:prefoldin subunit 5